ncbi:MAG: gliding motility-associated C-terminal domain-containing protein [Flavobacteriales bacterium]
MKAILLSLVALLTTASFTHSQTKAELEARRNYVGEKTTVEQFKKPLTTKSMRGGGGIVSTDCYTFVPIPDNATELDPFAFDNTSIAGLDGWWGPFDIDFDFCHFGVDYDEIYISAKGLISFDAGTTVFVPTAYPSNTINMVAGFWADLDYTCDDCGEVYMWMTETAVYVTYVDAGAFAGQGDIGNTFQIVITDQTDPIIGEGNNVGLFYQDMQWGVGNSAGGVGGFGGTAPANVGASRTNGNFVQVGRFSQNNDDYDGPFGLEDGVHWLDNKGFVFSICSSDDNLAPISFANDNCDTIFLCQNDTHDIELDFLAPEAGQNVTITVDTTNASGWNLVEQDGGFISGFFEGTTENTGTHTLIFTATDDGTPPASTVVAYDFVVQDILVPDLTVTGEALNEDDIASYCDGLDGVVLTASPGFDSYLWSDNSITETVTLNAGVEGVVGFFSGCQVEYGPITIFEIPVFTPEWAASELLLCDGDSSVITFEDADEFPDYEWSLPTGSGEILSEDEENNSITVIPGLYSVSVVDENGCTGASFISINEEILNLQEANFPQPQCDDNTATWTGSWANPNECPMVIFLYDSDADTWEGGFIEAFVDGAGPFIFSINNAAPLLPTGQDLFHGQTIEFFWNPGIDDDDIRIQLFEPGDNTVEIFDTDDGDQLIGGTEPFFTYTANCGYNALPGEWTITPNVGSLSDPGVYNPVDANQTYTAPEDYVGTVSFIFESDICEIVDEFDITFGTTPIISVTSDTVCGDEQATLELTVEPAALLETDLIIDWTPNGSPNADGELVASFNNSAEVTVSVEVPNCGTAVAEGTATVLPVPDPQLAGTTICQGTSFTLDPGTSHPSFSYDWTTGADTETISVTDAGNYGVTISNECGSETANLTLSVTPVPAVNFWASDTLICAGEEILVNPVWSGLPEGTPISWFLTFTDEMDNVQVVPYESTETSFILGADMLPADPINDAFLTYTYSNACGTAQGSVAADVQSCFVGAYNVISPDSDGSEFAAFGTGGLNEGWQIVGIDGVPNVDVQIFDRWGSLVYENSNYSNLNPWKGENLNGDELEDGVYFYTVYVPRGDKELTGTVTILRQN